MSRSNSLIGMLLALGACGGGDFIPAPAAPVSPTAVKLEIVSPSVVDGFLNEYLSTQLAVRVIDSLGHGVPLTAVKWTAFGTWPTDYKATTSTDSAGIALLPFQPLRLGTIQVIARIWAPPSDSVVFTITVHPGDSPVVIRFSSMFDCLGYPTLFDATLFDDPGPIPVETTVEWIYQDTLSYCTARLVSTTVPPGGQPFDSGILGPGQHFNFIPRVAGDWEYKDAINGGHGVLRVR